jgi:lipopolysaccharide/colanic/teichoic acid biosynthesis glycosyltransferase
LDELPQFWNILRGDMAYIGPRPEMVEVHWWAQRSVPGFDTRLWVKPGISGLAQLSQGYVGSDAEAYGHKLQADLQYLSRLTLLQDLSILYRTPLWMLRLRGWSLRSAVVMTPAKPAVPKVSGGVARPLDAMIVEASRVS